MFGPALLRVSGNRRVRGFVTTSPLFRGVVSRFVAGDDLPSVVPVIHALVSRGLKVTVDCLGEDTVRPSQAEATRDAYVALLSRLEGEGLSKDAEVSVKLSALGQALPKDGSAIAGANAYAVCEAAGRAGTTVTLDMEDHTTIDSTLAALRDLRGDFPWVGAVLQSGLRRTEADVRDLAYEGSRVRLVKGAYAEPRDVAYTRKEQVDAAYKRCLSVLFAQGAYPMVATHDQAMIAEALWLAASQHRDSGSFELQMLYGIRTSEQDRQIAAGRQVRVYVPFGSDWYGYFTRRLAERPANLWFFARNLASR